MLPDHDVGGVAMDELLHVVPAFFGSGGFTKRIAFCVVEEHARIAMMFLSFSPSLWT